MGFEEIVGFIISILAITYVIGRNIYEEIQKRRHPEDYAQKKHEQEDVLKNFLKSLEGDMEETKTNSHSHRFEDEVEEEEEARRELPVVPIVKTPPPRPVPRTVKDQFQFQSKIEHFRQKSAVEERKFKNTIETRYETQQLGDHVVSQDMQMDDPMRAYDIPISKEQVARGRTLLQSLHSGKKMIIIHEILSPPKGFRNF